MFLIPFNGFLLPNSVHEDETDGVITWLQNHAKRMKWFFFFQWILSKESRGALLLLNAKKFPIPCKKKNPLKIINQHT